MPALAMQLTLRIPEPEPTERLAWYRWLAALPLATLERVAAALEASE